MRKTRAKKRPLLPDPKFNDQLVTRFVNNLMYDGKKSVAFKIFYDALEIVDSRKEDAEKTSLDIWKEALSLGSILNDNPYISICHKEHLYFVRVGLNLGKQRLHPHDEGLTVFENIGEWTVDEE